MYKNDLEFIKFIPKYNYCNQLVIFYMYVTTLISNIWKIRKLEVLIFPFNTNTENTNL